LYFVCSPDCRLADLPTYRKPKGGDETVKTKKEWEQHIGVDPKICFGRPFVKGTRVPLWAVFSMLAAGVPAERVKQEYLLTDEQLQAIFAWAAEMAHRKRTPDRRKAMISRKQMVGARKSETAL